MPAKGRMTSWGVGPKFAVCSLIILLVATLVNIFLSGLILPFNLLRFSLGIVLILLGVAMCVSAGIQVHRAFDEGKLATTGLYAYVRNPVYAAFVWLIAPGLILATGLLLLIIMPFAMYALIRGLIGEEDRYLEQKFGQEYLEYRKKVSAVIPKL